MACRQYSVLLVPEPDGSAWNVKVATLPGCFTPGRTVGEALALARDAIATYLDGEDQALASEEPTGTVTALVDVEIDIVEGVVRVSPSSFLVPGPNREQVMA